MMYVLRLPLNLLTVSTQYVYVLVCLLLRRALRISTLASTVVLDRREMSIIEMSFWRVYQAVYDRTNELRGALILVFAL